MCEHMIMTRRYLSTTVDVTGLRELLDGTFTLDGNRVNGLVSGGMVAPPFAETMKKIERLYNKDGSASTDGPHAMSHFVSSTLASHLYY